MISSVRHSRRNALAMSVLSWLRIMSCGREQSVSQPGCNGCQCTCARISQASRLGEADQVYRRPHCLQPDLPHNSWRRDCHQRPGNNRRTLAERPEETEHGHPRSRPLADRGWADGGGGEGSGGQQTSFQRLLDRPGDHPAAAIDADPLEDLKPLTMVVLLMLTRVKWPNNLLNNAI